MAPTAPPQHLEIGLLTRADLPEVSEMDRLATGADRSAFLSRYVPRAGSERISLSFVARRQGRVLGFVLGGVYRGEFGAVEPLAILEVVGVAEGWRHRGVGHALFAAFARHAGRLGASRVRTLVAWNDFDLLRFFERMGMHPTGLVPLSVATDRVPPVPQEDGPDEL